MKKVVILAAAALTLAACAKTYELQETAQPKIGFDTWANNLTKAREQGTSTFVAGDDFAVYGYKAMSDNSNPQNVFEGVTVSTTNGTTWTYETPRFWDSNYDKYTFFAVSPASVGTSVTVNPQTGVITSTSPSTAITFAGNDNDILVADKKVVNKNDGNVYFNGYGTVPLVFNHVASLVDIKVKKTPALKDATVSVTALQLKDINDIGTLSVSDAYTNSHPIPTWTPTSSTTNYGNTNLNIAVAQDANFNPDSHNNPSASTDVISNLVVMPQALTAGQKISISYTIAVAGGDTIVVTDAELLLADFDNTNTSNQEGAKIVSWEYGKHYTYYITIDAAHAITFEASITPWTAVSGYNYLVY